MKLQARKTCSLIFIPCATGNTELTWPYAKMVQLNPLKTFSHTAFLAPHLTYTSCWLEFLSKTASTSNHRFCPSGGCTWRISGSLVSSKVPRNDFSRELNEVMASSELRSTSVLERGRIRATTRTCASSVAPVMVYGSVGAMPTTTS